MSKDTEYHISKRPEGGVMISQVVPSSTTKGEVYKQESFLLNETQARRVFGILGNTLR